MSFPIRFVSIVLVMLLLAGCGWTRFKATAPLTATADHVSGAAVSINSRNGSVEVRRDATISEVMISATVTCAGDTQAEADERIAAAGLSVSRDTSRTLHISPRFPDGPRSGDGATFVVRIPDAEGVTIDTSNGSVTVTGLAGALQVDTSNGSVTVTGHVGDAVIDTSNGTVKVVDHLGAVRADSSNGNAVMTLHPDAAGPVEMDTSNGSITLTVGPAFTGRLSASTSNGDISLSGNESNVRSSRIQRSSGEIVFGDGGVRSVLDTSNGNIRISIAGDAAE